MKPYLVLLILIVAACTGKKSVTESEAESTSSTPPELFELRTYYAAEDKLDNLLDRFRDHTMRIFDKYGMVNIAYWTPVENDQDQLIYLLGYKSRMHRDEAWDSFRQDPEWQAAYQASRVDGPLVDSIENVFLTYTDYSPEIVIADGGSRVFEMRTYYTNDGKLSDLHTRFTNHTMKLFEVSGMTNIAYFNLMDDQPGAESTMVYFLSHADTTAARVNWQAFLDNPDWQNAYNSSIQDGPLVDRISSVMMEAVDISPLK